MPKEERVLRKPVVDTINRIDMLQRRLGKENLTPGRGIRTCSSLIKAKMKLELDLTKYFMVELPIIAENRQEVSVMSREIQGIDGKMVFQFDMHLAGEALEIMNLTFNAVNAHEVEFQTLVKKYSMPLEWFTEHPRWVSMTFQAAFKNAVSGNNIAKAMNQYIITHLEPKPVLIIMQNAITIKTDDGRGIPYVVINRKAAFPELDALMNEVKSVLEKFNEHTAHEASNGTAHGSDYDGKKTRSGLMERVKKHLPDFVLNLL